VKIKNVVSEETSQLPVSGVFIFAGWSPNTKFLAQTKISLSSSGYIITDDYMKTSLDGVFACGDVRKKLLRQVVTAAADGATAAIAAEHYLQSYDMP